MDNEVREARMVLDVFLSAYEYRPDNEMVERDHNDDLLTWQDLRIILRYMMDKDQ